MRAKVTATRSDHAFIGYKSNMRSCSLVHVGNDRLRCETSWRYRLVVIVICLVIGLALPVQIGRGFLGDSPEQVPFFFLAAGLIMTGLAWICVVQSLLFSRAIEIDLSLACINLIQRGWRESHTVLPIGQVSGVVVESVTRRRDNSGGNNPENCVECWLLRVVLSDGGSRILCETTEQSVVEEMRSFLCKCGGIAG